MDVRTQMLVLSGFREPARSFWPGTSARVTPGRPRDIRSEKDEPCDRQKAIRNHGLRSLQSAIPACAV